MSCHNKQTGNDWRWADTRHDISPYQPEECVLWPCVSCTHENTLLSTFYFYFFLNKNFFHICYDVETNQVFSDILSLQYGGSVCRGQSCTAAVTNCDKHTQTEWFELHTAVGINSTSLPVNPCLVSSCRYVPAEECNRTNKSWTRSE